MGNTESDILAEQILNELGFTVERIKVSKQKSADYKIYYQNLFIGFIEAKLKIDDEQQSEDILKEGYKDRLETIIKKASKQLLQSSSHNKSGFSFMLYMAKGKVPEITIQQFKSTLYGSESLIYGMKEYICYFYTYAEYEKYNNIDASILVSLNPDNSLNRVEFCLNPFSQNYSALLSLGILGLFKTIVDPLHEEKQQKAFIVDKAIQGQFRKDLEFLDPSVDKKKYAKSLKSFPSLNPIIKYLKQKYNIPHQEHIFVGNFNLAGETISQLKHYTFQRNYH